MLKGLILHKGQPSEVDVDRHPWQDASLVTPRHGVRKLWNEAAVRKHCKKKGEQLLIVPAEDTINGRALTIKEKIAAANRAKTEKRRRNKDLPDTLELAKGMKVMVTSNVETDLDVTNGARGEIVDIILDEEEPDIGDGAEVTLKYMPKYVLVKLTRTRASRLEGLDENVIPVEPMEVKFKVKVPGGGERTVIRRQFPMTAAYAFTDYRAQGQTIPTVFVDIAKVPSGTLTLTALDFDEKILMQGIEVELMDEDDRLEQMDVTTKQWWEQMSQTSQ
ncbi:hypothetical protein VKT23_017692 [Stygiomarasmius scandens]|uniref:Uncharacterized protein n=1 Tax=Marasmiellus scandens TaxID=2682957 RepID=A0ABR1IRH1_9AGAR